MSLRLVARGPLGGHRWISAPAGRRRLVLVTCAPPYVPARGGYQNLAVVTACPSASRPGGPLPPRGRRDDPGRHGERWVLHEPAADGSGWSGWLYHYPDGTVVTEDGSVVDVDEPDEADDPGWFLVDPVTEGTPAARWLYEYADGTVVDDEGRVQVETPPVHLVAAPAVEAAAEEDPERRAPRRSSLSRPRRSPSPSPSRTPSPQPPVGRACRDHGALRARARDRVRDGAWAASPPPADPVVTAPGRATGPSHSRSRSPSRGPPSRWRSPRPRPPSPGESRPLLAPPRVPPRGSGPGARRRRGGRRDRGPGRARHGPRGRDASPAASRFDPPDAVPLDSEYVSSRVLPSGAVVVDHWVRTSRPFTDVRLEAPGAPSGAPAWPPPGRCASRRRRVAAVVRARSGRGASGVRRRAGHHAARPLRALGVVRRS